MSISSIKTSKHLASVAIGLVLLLPNISFAGADLSWFQKATSEFSVLVDTIIPVLFALALLLFVWGVINYFILGAGDEGKRETGRSYMLYAIIGLVAITAVWGIVGLFTQILGVDENDGFGTVPGVPQLEIPPEDDELDDEL